MNRYLFIDERKHGGYLLVAAVIEAHQVPTARRVVGALLLPGQRRIHMKAENPGRKRTIARALAEAGIPAVVYDAGRHYRTQREARQQCLRAIVSDHADGVETLMVIEEDRTLVDSDRRILYQAVREAGCVDCLHYDHRRAESERLLGIPDAIAWCWGSGNPWRTLVQPSVRRVRQV
ncbi:hypothetical protein KIH27_09720 [Mycobacterium sp. M1]|uniref:DUF3800 domain-containing protein n=1 Tax=Mycolicibacter acidiphilus TaxID=2835306 RepID=A0ABS5RHX4_9MYCO|nr:hypothetical protein [Mycolicibacter acidiphilus]MBS9533861.1 hypothetical protein [Mycolicibacter acidiphilus]